MQNAQIKTSLTISNHVKCVKNARPKIAMNEFAYLKISSLSRFSPTFTSPSHETAMEEHLVSHFQNCTSFFLFLFCHAHVSQLIDFHSFARDFIR